MRVCVTGGVDMDNSADVFASLLWCIDNPGVIKVHLDMRGTTFIDSSGIRAIMECHYAALLEGKVFRIVDWTAPVRRVFEMLGLADALEPDPETPK
jgi:anti-anti-sigma factor